MNFAEWRKQKYSNTQSAGTKSETISFGEWRRQKYAGEEKPFEEPKEEQQLPTQVKLPTLAETASGDPRAFLAGLRSKENPARQNKRNEDYYYSNLEYQTKKYLQEIISKTQSELEAKNADLNEAKTALEVAHSPRARKKTREQIKQLETDAEVLSKEILGMEQFRELLPYVLMEQRSDFGTNSQYRSTKNGETQKTVQVAGGVVDPSLQDFMSVQTTVPLYVETGYDDLTYEYINKNEDAVNMWDINENAIGQKLAGASLSFLREMTPEEIAIFNYIYATKGPEKAYAYTKVLEERLNYRYGTNLAERIMDDDGWENSAWIYGGSAGLEKSLRGILKTVSGEQLPNSYTQVADQKLQENLTGGAYYAYAAANTVGNMLPSLLVTAATSGYGAAAGWAAKTTSVVSNIAGSAVMGASTYGNTYDQALREGGTKEQAQTYAALVTASEVGLSALLGGVGSAVGLADDIMLAKAAKLDQAFARVAASGAIRITGEVTEEELQLFLDPAFRWIVYDEEYQMPGGEEMLDTAIITILATAVMEGPSTVGVEVDYAKFGKLLQEEYTQQDIIDAAMQETAVGSDAAVLAKKLAEKLAAGQKVSDADIGRLFVFMQSETLPQGRSREENKKIASEETEEKTGVVVETKHFDSDILNDLNKARTYFIDFARKHFTKPVVNKQTGKTIGIGRTGIDKFLSGWIGREKYASGFYIPELIENAYLVDDANNYHPNQVDSIPTYEYYDSPFLIDGKGYMAHIRVRNTNMGDKYYGHTISEVDKIDIEPMASHNENEIENAARTSASDNPTVQPVNDASSSISNANVSQPTQTVNQKSSSNPAMQTFEDSVERVEKRQADENSTGIQWAGNEGEQIATPPAAARNDTEAESADLIAQLRQDYNEGKITEEEFDEVMEALLEEESTAEQSMVDGIQWAGNAGERIATPPAATRNDTSVETSVENNNTATEDTKYEEQQYDRGQSIGRDGGWNSQRADGRSAADKRHRAAQAAQRRGAEAYQIQSDVKNLGVKLTSLREAGVRNGSEYRSNRIVPQAAWTESIQRAADIAAENGLNFVPMVGNLYINIKGKSVRVEAVIENGTIYVQADSITRDVVEVTNHEVFHAKIRGNAELEQKLIQHIRQNYSKQEISALIDKYSKVYSQMIDGLTEEKAEAYIWQEMLADAYADLQRFSETEGATAWTDYVREEMAEIETKNTAQEDGEARMSIETLPDGRKYVRADRQVLFGNDPEAWSEQLEDYINGKIRRGQDVQLLTDDGDVLTLTDNTAGKISSRYNNDGTTMDDATFERKARAGSHIDELAQISARGKKNVTDYGGKHGDAAKDGWNYRTAFFEDFDGKRYLCTISVEMGVDGKIVYNIGKMQERSLPEFSGPSVKDGAQGGETSSDISISEEGENSNRKFSLAGEGAVTADEASLQTAKDMHAMSEDMETIRQETGWYRDQMGKWQRDDGSLSWAGNDVQAMDEIYQDAVNSGDMETAQRLVDEAAKKAGYDSPKLYHGTNQFGFTKLDPAMSDDGISLFATTREDVAQTYSGNTGVRQISDTPLSAGEVRDYYAGRSLTDAEIIDALSFGKYRAQRLAPGTEAQKQIRKAVSHQLFDMLEVFGANEITQFPEGLSNALAEYLGSETVESTQQLQAELARLIENQEQNWPDAAYEAMEAVSRATECAGETEIYAMIDERYNSADYVFKKDEAEARAKEQLITKAGSGNYAMYGKTEGLLEIDGGGRLWKSLDYDADGQQLTTTRQIAKYAHDKGYPGVVIKNVYDDGMYASATKTSPSDIYIYFDGTQLKSADPVTYDDNGNVIALQERFNDKEEDMRYSMAGENARTADQAALQAAKDMHTMGEDMETIRQETGWYQGHDGKWRFEIDDSGMTYRRGGDAQFRKDHPEYARYRDLELAFIEGTITEEEAAELRELHETWGREYARLSERVDRGAVLLENILDHEELLRAYPMLRDIRVVFRQMDEGMLGSYKRSVNTIYINENLRNAPQETLLHEIQHVIQNEEGFAGGASYEYWEDVLRNGLAIRSVGAEKAIAALKAFETDPENTDFMEIMERYQSSLLEDDELIPDMIWQEIEDRGYIQDVVAYFDLKDEVASQTRRPMNSVPGELYRNTAGEIEARDVSRRRALTAEERRQRMPDLGDENTVFAENGYFSMSQNEQIGIREQLRENQDKLNSMEVVGRVNTQEYAGLDTGKAREKLMTEMKRTGYKVNRQGFGEIRFEEKEINNSLNYKEKNQSAEDARRTGFLVLQNVLKRGIEIGSHGDHKGRNYDTVTIAAPIEINGERGNMAVVVKRTKGNRYKVHRIMTPNGETFMLPEMANAEVNTVGAVTNGSQSLGGSAPTITSASEDIISKDADGVNTRYSAATEEVPIVDFLPAKAQSYLRRVERELTDQIGDQMDIPFMQRRGGLRDAVNHMAEEYLQNGDISQQTVDDLFELASGGKYDADAEAREKFDGAVAAALDDLNQVRRYADYRAEKNAPAPELTQEDVKQLYTELKDARKLAEKAVAKNLLTETDEVQIGKLLRGEIGIEGLDAEMYNVKGIKAVYEARAEYERIAKQIRQWNQSRKAQLREDADTFLQTANDWKDKSAGLLYSRETMERNIRDIVKDPKLAQQIIEAYFEPVHRANAEANKLKDRYRNKVRELQLSRKVEKGNTVSEAHAVQLLGEAEDNIRMLEQSKGRMKNRDGKTLDEWQAVVQALWESNPNLDQAKIRMAVGKFREIYDDLFAQMNEVRIRNGYEPVNYRNGYFPHFQPGDGGIMTLFGKALGIDTQVSALPTTINGLTHTFRPGITWFGNAQERLGFNTAYDAVEGFDKYIEGVADVIFHTDNIQRLRALASQIRYRTGDEGIRKQVDAVMADTTLSEQDKQNRIEKIYESGKYSLSNFVVDLEEYTNLLANKKSRYDRNVESDAGRRFYTIVKNLESRVAANMVAVNPASWLTNFIPLTQGNATLERGMLLQGMWETLQACKTDDGIVDMSSFLTNRRGSDPIVKTWQQSTSEKLSAPMEYIDQFVADSLVRARYRQNLKHDMSEDAAIREADAWVAGVMADRSKGSMPTLFGRKNPLAKLLTQFQLEANNQLSYLFKDVPKDTRGRGIGALLAAFIKFALGAFLFDEVYEYLIGRRPALDPLGILNDTVGDFSGYELPNLVEMGVGAIKGEKPDFKTEKKGGYGAVSGVLKNIAEDIPFVGGLLGGGRVPISSALPDGEALLNAAFNSEWDSKKRWKTAAKEVGNTAAYLAPPFGGGQIKKIVETVQAVHNHGSYNASGNLQYPVFSDRGIDWAGSVAIGSVFGKSSLPTAREWVENDFKGLNETYTKVYQIMLEEGEKDRTAWEVTKQLADAEKTDALSVADVRRNIIHEADISADTKLALYYAICANEDELGLIESLDEDPQALYEVLHGIKNVDKNMDKLFTVFESDLDEESMLAMITYISDTEGEKLRAASDYVDCGLYGRFLESYFREYGYEDKSQERVEDVLDHTPGLSNQEKAALWQMSGKRWKPSNNPYSTRVGQKIYDVLN